MVKAGVGALTVAVASLLAGCTADDKPAEAPAWREVHAFDDSLVARALEPCGDGWLVVGASRDSSDATAPAAYRGEGTSWDPLRFDSEELYARTGIVQSAGCRGVDVVALSTKTGGAHGLPRVRVWRSDEDGSMQDVEVPFELFGGPRAVGVGRLASGPHGYVVAGTRTTGAAAWTTASGRGFRLVEGTPALRGGAHVHRSAAGVAWTGQDWVLVGAATAPADGLPRAAAWSSRDARTWRREPVGGDGFGMLQQPVSTNGTTWAAGLRGSGIGIWERGSDGWQPVAEIDALPDDAPTAAYVTGLAIDDGTAYVSFSDGRDFQVWEADLSSPATWHPVGLPEDVTAVGDQQVEVASGDGGVLLLADGEGAPAVWAPAP